MNKLVQPRKAMQLTVLVCAVLFSSLVLGMIVSAVDAHWTTLILLGMVLVASMWTFGPVGYALEPRSGTRVRLHRAIGVVELDLRDGFAVARSRRGGGGLVLIAGKKRYRLFGSLGTPELVDEWLRRAQR